MALRHLSLRDFVIVAELDLEWQAGFSALTGETGAGKSILIDALQLVLGGRGDGLWVRQGCNRCEIAAEFDTPAGADPWLDHQGFEREPGTPLLLRRTIDATGKSRAWINGTPATLGQLRELGEWLVDIHGQHAWQSLTRPAAVRQLLDAYAGVDSDALASAWQAWQRARSTWLVPHTAQAQLAGERERLSWQIGELERLAPRAGEWDELNQVHTRLSHAQGLIDAAQAAAGALETDDGDGGALPALARAQAALQPQSAIEPEFALLLEQLQACEAQARDVARGLHAYLRNADPDPDRLAQLDARMGEWLGLARRYRHPPEELPALLASWRTELERLDAASDLAHLQAAADHARSGYEACAARVSELRRASAPRLAAAVTAAMQELGMPGGTFEVGLEPLHEPAAHGLEAVQFLVAAHAGTTPRAVERVASGGELSRLALAIAVTTSTLGTASTLIFDEVDAGIGGAVAATVGRLLQRLGQDRQVLCVTHLPQVAARADHHLVVAKVRDASGETLSTVRPVDGEARTSEIARMLGDARISSATLAHARELLGDGATAAPKRARKSGARA